MDEHKSRQSPGMTDNQMGQSRNMFSLQEAEEVCSIVVVGSFESYNNCFSFCRLVNFYSSPLLSDIWFQQLQPGECPRGSGRAVLISKTSAQSSSRQLFTSTHHRFTRRTTISITRNSRLRSNIL
jgi:hypothetical protein